MKTLKVVRKTITLLSESRTQLLDITKQVRNVMLGVAVGITGGEMSLGRFQSVIFAELDGPRQRSIDLQIMGV